MLVPRHIFDFLSQERGTNPKVAFILLSEEQGYNYVCNHRPNLTLQILSPLEENYLIMPSVILSFLGEGWGFIFEGGA